MSKDTNILIALIVAMVLFGGLLSWTLLEWDREEPPDPEEEAKKVFDLDKRDIVSIRLQYTDDDNKNQDIRLKKGENEQWKLTSPVVLDTDSSTVGNLTHSFSTLRADRVFKAEDIAPENESSYGLVDMKTHFSFEDKEGTKHQLDVGGTGVGDTRYCRRDDEKQVYLLTKWGVDVFRKSVFDLRNKSVLDIFPNAAVKVAYRGDDLNFEAVKRTEEDGDIWYMVRPDEFRIKDGFVDDLLEQVERLKMSEIVAEGKGEKLDKVIKERELAKKTAIDIQVWEDSTTTAPKQLAMSREDSEKNGRYARDFSRPIVFVIRKSDTSKVVDAAEELAEAKWEPPTPTDTPTPILGVEELADETGPATGTTEGAEMPDSIDDTLLKHPEKDEEE